MIIGVGVDIINVDRIRKALANQRTGSRFRQRVFTDAEVAYCDKRRNAHESYAARFAAKEAVIKALGKAQGWRDIEVLRSSGPPRIVLHGRAEIHAAQLGIRRFHLALSHTAELAIAYAVAEA